MRRKALTLLLALLPLAGCELAEVVVAEPEPLVVAEIYLRVTDGVSDALTLLHQPRSREPVSLGDAVVRVRSSAGELATFENASLAACVEGPVPPEFDGACYRLSPAQADLIRPGESYEAEVLLSGGKRIEGRVTLPGDFSITSPTSTGMTCRLPPHTLLRVRWTQSRGARAYVPEAEIFGLVTALAPSGIEVPSDPLVLLGLSVSETDTDIIFPSQFGVFNRFSRDQDVLLAIQNGLPSTSRIQGRITVSAQGRNAVNWNRGGNFNPSGAVRTPSLFGDGTGVVAGVVNRTFTFSTEGFFGTPSCLPGGN
jgi:hypothetical protein